MAKLLTLFSQKKILGAVLFFIIAFFVVSVAKITDITLAASQSGYGIKVFVKNQDTLELALNNWFATRVNIIVDNLNIQDYGGGGYLVVVSYHTGGAGNTPTRFKLIDGENPEADANIFLSSLSPSQTVRSISATTGSYSGPETNITIPIIFIVYE